MCITDIRNQKFPSKKRSWSELRAHSPKIPWVKAFSWTLSTCQQLQSSSKASDKLAVGGDRQDSSVYLVSWACQPLLRKRKDLQYRMLLVFPLTPPESLFRKKGVDTQRCCRGTNSLSCSPAIPTSAEGTGSTVNCSWIKLCQILTDWTKTACSCCQMIVWAKQATLLFASIMVWFYLRSGLCKVEKKNRLLIKFYFKW